MKIAIAIDRLDPSRGGLESWTRDLVRWLVRRGHDVHVAAFGFATDPGVAGATLHTVQRTPSRVESSAVMTHYIRNLASDVVHDLGIGWHFDVWQPQFGCRPVSRERHHASIPWRQRWQGTWSLHQRRRWRELDEIERRQIDHRGGRIVTASRMVAAHFQSRHGLPADRIDVIYNGVDPQRFSPEACSPLRTLTRHALDVAAGTTVVLMVATNFYLKGLSTALHAVARLVERGFDIRFVVAGGGDETPFVPAVNRLGIGRHVMFLGHVQDTLPYYAAADVFVLPSYHDTCSLSVLEAWACGVPAITTRWNGASELMRAGGEGYVLERADDHDRLAFYLEALLDPAHRAVMGRAARDLAMRCTLDDNFSRLEDVYVKQRDRNRAGAIDRTICVPAARRG